MLNLTKTGIHAVSKYYKDLNEIESSSGLHHHNNSEPMESFYQILGSPY